MENSFPKNYTLEDIDELDNFEYGLGPLQKLIPTKSADGNSEYVPIEAPKQFFTGSNQKKDEDLSPSEDLPDFLYFIFSNQPTDFEIPKKEKILSDFDELSQRSPSTPLDAMSEIFLAENLRKRTHDELKSDNAEEFEPMKKQSMIPLDCIEYPKQNKKHLQNKAISRQNSFPSNENAAKSQLNNSSKAQQNQVAESHSILVMPVVSDPQAAIIEREIKNKEKAQIPIGTKTCFSMSLTGKKNKVLELASVKGKEKDNFKEWSELKDLREIKIKLEHFRLEESKILENLQMVLEQIDQLENISLDFSKTRYESSVQEKFENRLERLLQISFEGQESLENIHLIWNRPEGVKIVSQHIQQQLQRSASTLKHLDLELPNTKLDYDYFQLLIEKMSIMHGEVSTSKLKTFKYAAELVSFREERGPFTPLSMPDVKEFALDLTCSGPFGGELMEFITESLSSMTKIETLCIKLAVRDFRDNTSEEKWIEKLFECIQNINQNLIDLRVIISLDKKDQRQNEDARFRSLVSIAAKSLKVHKIRELVIGPNILKPKKLSGNSNVSTFLLANMPKNDGPINSYR